MPEPGFEHFPGVGQASGLKNKEEDNHQGPTYNPKGWTDLGCIHRWYHSPQDWAYYNHQLLYASQKYNAENGPNRASHSTDDKAPEIPDGYVKMKVHWVYASVVSRPQSAWNTGIEAADSKSIKFVSSYVNTYNPAGQVVIPDSNKGSPQSAANEILGKKRH